MKTFILWKEWRLISQVDSISISVSHSPSKGKDCVERHLLKARNIYRCNVIPSNEACGPSLALYDNRRIFWQKNSLLLRSACCPSKPIFDWHLCPIETGITPSEWAWCQASRWVWAKACQKPSMWIKFKYQGPKLPSRNIKTTVCWELFVLKVKGHAISTAASRLVNFESQTGAPVAVAGKILSLVNENYYFM